MISSTTRDLWLVKNKDPEDTGKCMKIPINGRYNNCHENHIESILSQNKSPILTDYYFFFMTNKTENKFVKNYTS